MRIPSNLTDEFSITLNRIYANTSKLYLDDISKLVQVRKVNTMLNDASVTQQETFEPQGVTAFFEQLGRRLEHWSSQGIEKTDTDDMRRLHLQLNTSVGKYELSCYLAIQYHALPFYRCDSEVIEMKKKLVELDERIAELGPAIEKMKNALLEEELRKRGMGDLNIQDLLVTMYNDEKLFSALAQKVQEIEESNPGYYQAMEERERLLARLNGMIFEVYRIKPALIDQNGLLQGEEGAALHFDLQVLNKDGGRSGRLSMAKVQEESKETIIERFREIEEVLGAIE